MINYFVRVATHQPSMPVSAMAGAKPPAEAAYRRLRGAAVVWAWCACAALLAPAHADQPPPGTPALRLYYEGRGLEKGFFHYRGSGELRWAPAAPHYLAQLDIYALGLRVRSWTSSGEIGAQGLLPTRFDDAPRGTAWSTSFLRDKALIRFSSGAPDQPLQAGAQDKLSALLQLGILMGREPAPPSLGFQAADAHHAEWWDFHLDGPQQLRLPGGDTATLKLTRAPTPDSDQKIEVWLAPAMSYLPVRIRITEGDASFIDLLWQKSQKSD